MATISIYELTNIDGVYERDIIHFRWMCGSCHAIMDGRGCGVHSPRPGIRIRNKRINQEIQQKVISAHLDGYGRNEIDRLMSEQGVKVSHGSISNIINAYKREHGQSQQSQEYLAKTGQITNMVAKR